MATGLTDDTPTSIDSGEDVDDASTLHLHAAIRALDQIYGNDLPMDLGALCQLIEEGTEYYQNLRMTKGLQQDETYEAYLLRPLLREYIPAIFNKLMSSDYVNEKQDLDIHEACLCLAHLLNEMMYFQWEDTNNFSAMLTPRARLDIHGPLSALACICYQNDFNERNCVLQIPSSLRVAPPLVAGKKAFEMLTVAIGHQQLVEHVEYQGDQCPDKPHRDRIIDLKHSNNSSQACVKEELCCSVKQEESISNNTAASAQREQAIDEKSTDKHIEGFLPALEVDKILQSLASNPDAYLDLLGKCYSDSCKFCALNVLNHWLPGFQILCEILKHPDRCGIIGCATFLQPIPAISSHLIGTRLRELKPGIKAVLNYIEAGFEAADGFSAFESPYDSSTKNTYLLAIEILNSCFTFTRWIFMEGKVSIGIVDEILDLLIILQQEVVLRLLSSENFAQQLASVKELEALIDRIQWIENNIRINENKLHCDSDIKKYDEGSKYHRYRSRKLEAWIKSNDIIGQLLRVNLHQSQYIDSLRRALWMLFSNGSDVFEENHLEYLWGVLLDSNTFEDIKINVYNLVGTLCPQMSQRNQEFVFRRIGFGNSFMDEKELPSQDCVYILDMLATTAQHDKDGKLIVPVLKAILGLILCNGAKEDVAKSNALTRACIAYDNCFDIWMHLVVLLCEDALRCSDNSIEIGTIAAYQLNMIIDAIFLSPDLRRLYTQKVGDGSELLNRVCCGFNVLLEIQFELASRQRCAHENISAHRRPMFHMAPDIGPFTHMDAVLSWHRLLKSAIYRAGCRLSAQTLQQLLLWATDSAVTFQDASSAWNLLENIAVNKVGLEENVAQDFFLDSLRHVIPSRITRYAWKSISAFMARISNWSGDIVENQYGINSGDDLKTFFSSINELLVYPNDPYGILPFLDNVAMGAPNETTVSASELLAALLSKPLRTWNKETIINQLGIIRKHLDHWKQIIIDSSIILSDHLPNCWNDLFPTMPSLETKLQTAEASITSPSTHGAVLKAVRALYCLYLTLRSCQLKEMPSVFSHLAAYRDLDIVINVQFTLRTFFSNEMDVHELPVGTVSNIDSVVTLPICIASNVYVGTLRRAAAAAVSNHYSPYKIPSHAIRLISKDFELLDDSELLCLNKSCSSKITLDQSNIDRNNDCLRPLLDLSDPCPLVCDMNGLKVNTPDGKILARSEEIHGLLLSLSQYHFKDDIALSRSLNSNATALLNILPTSSIALQDAKRLAEISVKDPTKCLSHLLSLLQIQNIDASTDREKSDIWKPNPNIFLYLLEAICTIIRPAENPFRRMQQINIGENCSINGELLQALLYVATKFSCLGGQTIAPLVHWAMYMIGFSFIDMLSTNKNESCEGSCKLKEYHTRYSEVLQSLAKFSLVSIMALLNDYAQGPVDMAKDSEKSSRAINSGFSSANKAMECFLPFRRLKADRICHSALTLLKLCIIFDTSVFEGIVSDTNPNSDQCSSCKQIEFNLLPLLERLLNHPNRALRETTLKWIEEIVRVQSGIIVWIFRHIVKGLALKDSVNKEQASLCHIILNEVGNSGSIESSEGLALLDQLVSHLLCEIAKYNSSNKADIRNLDWVSSNIMTLLKRLDAYSSCSSVEMVERLMNTILFPDLKILNEASLIASESNYEKATDFILDNYVLLSNSARSSAKSRDACRCLLAQLLTHDPNCWKMGIAILYDLLDAGSIGFSHQSNNCMLKAFRPQGKLAGLHNGGATCYMNATLQQLFMQPKIRNAILRSPSIDPEKQSKSIFHQVQKIFAHLAGGIETAYEPIGFWRAFKDYDGRPIDIREHQDAYEFFTRLQDFLDEHLKSVLGSPAIYSSLGGTFATVISVPQRPELRSERNEDFYQISLDVRGKKDLMESLESYVAPELMNGANQWYCEELGVKIDAEKRQLIRRLPSTLMFHLKRFEWDYETGTRWKIKDRFEFPRELDMEPFTVDAVLSQNVTHNMASKDQIARKSHFMYQLSGIVVHSGTAFAGHYYSFILDRSSRQWYRFDDTEVEQWDPSNLEIDCFGGNCGINGEEKGYSRPNSAYMLLYERCDVLAGSNSGVEMSNLHTVSQEKAIQETHSNSYTTLFDIPGLDINMDLLRDLGLYNLHQIAASHLLGRDMFLLFDSILLEARLAAASSLEQPRKSQKLMHSKSPSSSKSSSHQCCESQDTEYQCHGLARLVSISNVQLSFDKYFSDANETKVFKKPRVHCQDFANDIDSILSTCVRVYLKYLCCIVARGPADLIAEVAPNRAKQSMHANGNFLISMRPEVAKTVIQFASSEETGENFIQAIECCHHRVYAVAKSLLIKAVGTRVEAIGINNAVPEVISMINILFEWFLRRFDEFQMQEFRRWEQILSLLASFATYRILPEMLLADMFASHLPTLLKTAPSIASLTSQHIRGRNTVGFPFYFLDIMSLVFRKYSTYWLADPTSQAVKYENPGILPSHESEYAYEPIPKEVWDLLFGDEFLRQLLRPGLIGNSGDTALNFLMWITHNNISKQRYLTDFFLKHLLDDCPADGIEIATDIPILIQVLTMDDDCVSERVKDILFGIKEDDESEEEKAQVGLIDAVFFPKRPNLWTVACARATLLIADTQPDAWMEAWGWAIDANVTEGETQESWALNALRLLERLSESLSSDIGMLNSWQEQLNEVPASYHELYNLRSLEDDLQELLGDDEERSGAGDSSSDDSKSGGEEDKKILSESKSAETFSQENGIHCRNSHNSNDAQNIYSFRENEADIKAEIVVIEVSENTGNDDDVAEIMIDDDHDDFGQSRDK